MLQQSHGAAVTTAKVSLYRHCSCTFHLHIYSLNCVCVYKCTSTIEALKAIAATSRQPLMQHNTHSQTAAAT